MSIEQRGGGGEKGKGRITKDGGKGEGRISKDG